MIQGSDFVVKVDIAGVATAIADINKFHKASERDSNQYAVFGRALKYVVTDAHRNQSFDISGYLAPTDPGQLALFTAESANSVAAITVLFDGTNGFKQSCYVNSFTYDSDPESPQEIGFTLSASAASTIVAAGPIM